MKKYIFYLALTGWILSLVIHLLSLADFDIREKFPFTWLLHIGLLVSWIFTILELKKNKELQQYTRSTAKNNQLTVLKIIFKQTPTWVTAIAICGFIYALINFAIFMLAQEGTALIRDNQFVLQSHGKFIKNLTEQEYHHYRANELRGFSGHWIAFYGIATAILFSTVSRESSR